MAPENTNNSKILSDNWADDLLVKEADGHFHLYQPMAKTTPAAAVQGGLAQKIAAPTPVPAEDKFLPVVSPNGPQAKSAFGFHPEDESEVKELSKELPADSSRKYSLEKIIDKLVSEEKLKFTPETETKFADILYDFFRNRRNAILVRELLSERILSNAKILSEEQVDNIVTVIKIIKTKIDQVGGLVVKMADLPEVESPLSKKIIEKKLLTAGLPKASGQTQEEVNQILSALPEAKPKAEVSKKIPATPELPAKVKTTVAEPSLPGPILPPIPATKTASQAPPASLPRVFRQPTSIGGKKAVSDVKVSAEQIAAKPQLWSSIPPAKSTLTGPLEELKALDLDGFRRLGLTADEQTDKISRKINVLEKDSITKKAQGIEAWRSSEVYRLYLNLGAESLSQGKDVATVIDDWRQENKPTLTLDEFSAISDLNKLLRF